MIIRTNTTELNIILLITASRMVYKFVLARRLTLRWGNVGLLVKDWFLRRTGS